MKHGLGARTIEINLTLKLARSTTVDRLNQIANE
jgi:hypothetical protein